MIELFDKYGIDYRQRSNWIQFDCPNCSDTKKHAAISERGIITCFKCGKLPTWRTLHELGISHKDIQKKLGTVVVDKAESALWRDVDVVFPRGTVDSPSNVHRRYLAGRRFDIDWLIERFGIKFTNHLSTLPNRIVIPIYFEDVLISWQARSCVGGEPKYVNESLERQRYPMKSMLYNFQNVDDLVLCEGVTDVWRAEELGWKACCAFGKTLTDGQYHILSSVKSVIVAFDNEPEARRSARVLTRTLSGMGIACKKLRFKGNDLGDLH